MFDDTLQIPSIQFLGESMVCLTYTVEEDFLESLNNTNPVIAAFVTTQARLELFKYLRKLQERVLYFDTGKMTCFLEMIRFFLICLYFRLDHLPNEAKRLLHRPNGFISWSDDQRTSRARRRRLHPGIGRWGPEKLRLPGLQQGRRAAGRDMQSPRNPAQLQEQEIDQFRDCQIMRLCLLSSK